MGNGVSALTTEQRIVVTQILKDKFIDLSDVCSVEQVNDELTRAYNEQIKLFSVPQKKSLLDQYFPTTMLAVSTAPTTPESIASNSPKVTPHGNVRNVSMISKLDTPSNRRITRKSIDLSVKLPVDESRGRSYAVYPTKAHKRRMSCARTGPTKGRIDDDLSVNNAIASVEAAELALCPPATDSWESVQQQPFCSICQMAFKSTAFLERHVKYSNLHAKLQNQALGGCVSPTSLSKHVHAEVVPEAAAAAAVEDVPLIIQPSAQEEGVHYRLFYHGCKFFWKHQKSIDFDIYFHILANTFEVIAFDVERHKELTRLYLDGVSLEEIIELSLQEEVEERKKALFKDRFACIPTDQVLREDLKRNLLTTTILQRLQLHSDILDKSFELGLVFVTNGDDTCMHNPCMEKAPVVVVPVSMHARRRKSTTSEINQAFSTMRLDREEVVHYLDKASKFLRQPTTKFEMKADQMARIVYEVVSYLQNRRLWYAKSSLNVMQLKWYKTINKVVFMNSVQKMRVFLESAQLKHQFKRTMTLRRGPSVRAKDW